MPKRLTKKAIEDIIKKYSSKNMTSYSVAKRWKAFDIMVSFKSNKYGKVIEKSIEGTIIEGQTMAKMLRKIQSELKFFED